MMIKTRESYLRLVTASFLTISVFLIKQKYCSWFHLPASDKYLEENRYNELRPEEERFSWSMKQSLWTLDRSNVEHADRNPNQLIWPQDSTSDRIVDQLLLTGDAGRILKIKPPEHEQYPSGCEFFHQSDCSVKRCQITYNSNMADALIFLNSDVINEPLKERRADQIWIAYLLESPSNTYDKRFPRLYRGNHIFNWTASYRSDSDIVTPYSKFVPYRDQLEIYNKLKAVKTIEDRARLPSIQPLDSLKKRAGRVAWLVSNCHTENNRLNYAKDLSKYIQVDIYGKCGSLICPKWNETGCLEMINENYKFYLSFENSNYRQYITEKLYKNALGYNNVDYQMVPIVMGAPRRDYENLAPPASFIHVDDFESPRDLADYLKLLDRDEKLYRSYLSWKRVGHFIDTKFLCRVCAMLHHSLENRVFKSYQDIKRWWSLDNKT